MILTIKSTIDLNVIFSQEVTDKQTSGMYYAFDISLPADIPDGEYEYTLTDGNDILSTGMMTILGKIDHRDTQYQKEITYKQYETN